MTENQFRKHVKGRIDYAFDGNKRQAAKAWGTSESHLHKFLNGSEPPHSSLVDALGYVKDQVYRRKG